ncbi:MAG: peptide chain release factor N(5)-glutamine methyltransferase [Thermodesulfovibrionales bacterium]|nr:peptide chain release factor N(5)-glutamine methyltransferase [Thermodesulfovibrionales bacterium]
MRALEKLREATEFLKKCDIEDASREAEIIITHCLGTDRAAFFRDNPGIRENELGKIDEFLNRRSKREPLQYILGYVDFYGLKIKVGKGVLIPRPETELLVEEAINIISNFALNLIQGRISNLKLLDLCTGSGCLALALAKEFPDAQVYGTDTSEIAIGYAKENAELNGIKNVKFLKGSLFEPVEGLLGTFDLIVSNPPYIKRNDIKSLQPEVKDWEPIEALDGGEDGLDYCRAIIPEAKSYLKEGGCLILELGFDQADAVRKNAQDASFINISLIKDYAGIERIFVAELLRRS